jgi:tripeptidyl-peptidase-2
MKKILFFTGSILLLLRCILWSQTAPLPESPWNFLDTKTIGAYDFLKSHPTYDGRGVVIMILDSGVDMGVPGLFKTSEGKTKVIDAQDFSGQGDIHLEKAEIDSSQVESFLKTKELKLSGWEKLSYQPTDRTYWIGCISEEKLFKNSEIPDINNNGKTDDIFGLLTFPVNIAGEKRWVYYIDEDADGNVNDETPRFDYHYNYDTFSLRGRDPNTQKKMLTFSLNIDPDNKLAIVHACDNSHGTHCAGIAAGFELFGEPTQHGIAPGAQIISGKIGNGLLSGGATTTGSMKRAYDYGVKWSEDHNVPVVFSMSYGIGSEQEGRSDIEKYLNEIMEKNKNIIAVVSNGNEGPGIGSTGDPSAASRVLSVGAMLSYGSARDSYGFADEGDRLFHFSSRGGEVDKPDVIAPGAAASSVPSHASRENFWGTSMSCPQISGAAAVLISACLQENIPFNGALIKRALKYSGAPLADYYRLDQGRGIPNLSRALEIMKIYAQRNEKEKLADYQIETKSPIFPDEKGETAYWRAGNYLPDKNSKQLFAVKAIFPSEMTADEKNNFYRAYDLKVDQSWFKLDKASTYIRGNEPAKIGGYFQADLLRNPGLYVATVSAYPKSLTGKNIPEFQLVNTVIVPYIFSPDDNYQLRVSGKLLKAGEYHRYFVLVPAGASSMTVKISPSAGKWCGIYAYIFNPEGVQVRKTPSVDPQIGKAVISTIEEEDLIPGVWEIIPYAYHDLNQTSIYDLEIRFDGISVDPDPIDKICYESGDKPNGTISVINNFQEFHGKASGKLTGYTKSRTLDISSDHYRYEFQTGEEVEKVIFELEMNKETYNLFTDVAVMVQDMDDNFLENDGFDQRKLSVEFQPPKPGKYRLEIWAGFTFPDKSKQNWQVKMTEKYLTREKILVRVTKNNSSEFILYPSLPVELKFELEQTPRLIPDQYSYSGFIEFENVQGATVASVPITVRKQ